jgi:hypothetical protein
MSKLLRPSFAAQINSAQRWVPYSHVLRVFHIMGLAARTMGLVAHTIGLAALLGDGLVLEFLVIISFDCNTLKQTIVSAHSMYSATKKRMQRLCRGSRYVEFSSVGYSTQNYY